MHDEFMGEYYIFRNKSRKNVLLTFNWLYANKKSWVFNRADGGNIWFLHRQLDLDNNGF